MPGSTEPSGGTGPREMALASFNHDAFPDLDEGVIYAIEYPFP